MIGFLKNLIPAPYRWLAGIVFTVALLGSVSYIAYNKGRAQADIQISAYKNKKADVAKELVDKNLEINDRIVIRYVDKIKVVHDKQVVYVNTASNLVPAQNDLSSGWVYTHNQAALGLDIVSDLARNPTSSGVKDNAALVTIAYNYTQCETDREQLRSLQAGISEWNAAVEASKKPK